MTTKPHKIRLDELVLARGLAESRTQAQRLILAGQVRQGDQVLDKAGQLVPEDADVRVEAGLPYVSRGGLKLAAALDAFGVDPAGWVCADIGASTGRLHRLSAAARGGTRVRGRCGLRAIGVVAAPGPARDLHRADEHPPPGLAAGVGRAGYRRRLVHRPVLGAAEFVKLLAPGGQIIALIKPQFEVGKGQVGKGGVVRDPQLHARRSRRCLPRPCPRPDPVRRDPLADHRAGRQRRIPGVAEARRGSGRQRTSAVV